MKCLGFREAVATIYLPIASAAIVTHIDVCMYQLYPINRF